MIARIDAQHPKIPAQEQLLSAGCVAYNLLLGAQALGFGAQWLTGWAAYDRDVATLLGLAANEHVIGFVHIGTRTEPAPERTRPVLADVASEWHDDTTVHLVDGSLYVCRAWFAQVPDVHDADGAPVHRGARFHPLPARSVSSARGRPTSRSRSTNR